MRSPTIADPVVMPGKSFIAPASCREWRRSVGAMLAFLAILFTAPIPGFAETPGTEGCGSILRDPVTSTMTLATPETYWLRGYLVGRRAARLSGPPTVASVASNAAEDAAAWHAVVEYCRRHDHADLAEAARAYAAGEEKPPGPWCSVMGGCQAFGRAEGSDAFGSEAAEQCATFNRVERTAPGHTLDVFGPWLQGFLTGRAPSGPDHPPVDTDAQWTRILAYCRAQPDRTYFDAAQALVAPPG